METIAAWWFIVVGSWWTLLFMGVFVFWLVHEESDGWAILWLLVASALAFHIFSLDLKTFLMYLVAYIPVGVGWSFYRWKRFCNKEVDEYNERKADHGHEQGGSQLAEWEDRNFRSLENKLAPSNNITRLVQWIIVWPFSVIDNVLGDIYDMIVQLVKKHLINLYTKISSNALSKVQ
jgi:hypothetical protein